MSHGPDGRRDRGSAALVLINQSNEMTESGACIYDVHIHSTPIPSLIRIEGFRESFTALELMSTRKEIKHAVVHKLEPLTPC